MVTVRVNHGFVDLLNKVDRVAGEEFAATEARAEQLVQNLPPGFVEVVGKVAETPEEAGTPTEDLAKKTVAELTAIAKERGITVPAKPKKAELLMLLKG